MNLARQIPRFHIPRHHRLRRPPVQQAQPVQHRHVQLLLHMGQPQMLQPRRKARKILAARNVVLPVLQPVQNTLRVTGRHIAPERRITAL